MPPAGAVIATVGGVVSPVTAALASFEARPDVAGGVLGGDLVVVGAGGEAGVGVARAGRLRDPVAALGREAGSGRAVDVVADDADVVGGGAPGRGSPVPRPPVAVSVAGALGGVVSSATVAVDLVRGGADVAGGVLGGDLVVVGAGGEAGVGVARPRRLRDPVRASLGVKPALVDAVDVVLGDADVVGRGAPAQADLRRSPAVAVSVPGAVGGVVSAAARRSRRLVHVDLDLAGAERAVVDADVVDAGRRRSRPGRAVGADPPDVRAADAAGDGAAGDLGAVDVEAGGACRRRWRRGAAIARRSGSGPSRGSRRGRCCRASAGSRPPRWSTQSIGPLPVQVPTIADVLLGALAFCTQASSVKPLW